jgi:hypothetical protein
VALVQPAHFRLVDGVAGLPQRVGQCMHVIGMASLPRINSMPMVSACATAPPARNAAVSLAEPKTVLRTVRKGL